LNCLQEHGPTFPCGCNSFTYGPGGLILPHSSWTMGADR
jgi:hypothetical protein